MECFEKQKNCMHMQFSAKLHAHASLHAIFGAWNSYMMGVYQLVWTSGRLLKEMRTLEQMQTSFFWGRWLGRFFHCIFFLNKWCAAHQFWPKNSLQNLESCNTYSHGILSWEKGFSTKSEKRLRQDTRIFKIRCYLAEIWGCQNSKSYIFTVSCFIYNGNDLTLYMYNVNFLTLYIIAYGIECCISTILMF